MDRIRHVLGIRYLTNQQTWQQRIQNHAIFWAAFVSFHLLYFTTSYQKILSTPHWTAAYTVYYIRFIPIFYLTVSLFLALRKKYMGIRLVLMTLTALILTIHLMTAGVYYFLDLVYGLDSLSYAFQTFGSLYLNPPAQLTVIESTQMLVFDILEAQLLILPLGLKMVKYGLKGEFARRDLEAEKLRHELITLKAQTAPHFVLNTINAAFAQVKPVSETTAEYLDDLGSLLHYALYQTRDDLVSLDSEWIALLHYTRLESLRFEKVTITIHLDGIITSRQFIPTFMLLTLVENAFKHGVYTSPGDCWVNITLLVDEQWLTYTVENSASIEPFNPMRPREKGIGLENIRRRLELKFPDQHRFLIEKTPDHFSVQIHLPHT